MAKKDRDAVRQGMGDLLGPSSDLLSQVLEGDRRRTGRGHPPVEPEAGTTDGPAETTGAGEGPGTADSGPAPSRSTDASSPVANTTGSMVGSTTDETVASATDHGSGSDTDRPEPVKPGARPSGPAETGEVRTAPAEARTKPRGKGGRGADQPAPSVPSAQAAPPSVPAVEPPAVWNPLEAALREMLGKPYATDLEKGPFTVTSMKLHAEVSERLGWASSLTKRPKQDIVSEALRQYFERLLREG